MSFLTLNLREKWSKIKKTSLYESERLSPANVLERTALWPSRIQRKAQRYSEQISAKKNLFLETGWYHPRESGFQCLKRDFLF
jgi:hypothetical protein